MINASNNSGPKAEAKSFIIRVGLALLRVLAMAILMGCHWALNTALKHVVPSNLTSALVYAEDVEFTFFMLLNLYLLWDMLAVFIPRLSVPEIQKMAEKDEVQGARDES